jgi:hypothetical protein
MDRIMPLHISRRRLAVLKTTLRNISPAIGSSHADEALAFALGFKTYASLLAVLRDLPDAETEFYSARLIERLEQLGYGFAPPTAQRISMLALEAFSGKVMTRLQDAASHPANDNDSKVR